MAIRSEPGSWDAAALSAGDVHRRLLESTHDALVAAAAWAHQADRDVAGRRADVSRAGHVLEERWIEHRASLVGLRRVLAHPEATEPVVDAARRATDQTEALVTEAQQAVEDAGRRLEELAGQARSTARLLPDDELPDGDILAFLPLIAARLDHHAHAVAAAMDEASEWLATTAPT